MTADAPPQRVLGDALHEVVGDDRVVAALFVTYQLQPEFFEDSILGPLLGIEERGSARMRRVLLEQRVRETDVAVLYDRNGLVEPAPLRQDIRAVAVDWTPGFVLHAKHALALLEREDGPRALVLLTTSANLTESGWWKNVEICAIEVIEGGSASSLRADLLRLLERLGDLLGQPEPLPAVQRIEHFLSEEVSAAGGLPRLWIGHEPLATFLANQLPEGATVARLEVGAPYVDERAAPVIGLHGALKPAELAAWLPRTREEEPAATQGWIDAVHSLAQGHVARLHGVDRSLGKGATGTRFVHAKFVRIHLKGVKRCLVLAGSPNLTPAAHAGAWSTAARRANIETALLSWAPAGSRWLVDLAKDAVPSGSEFPESDRVGSATLPLRIRYDWERDEASARLDRHHEGPIYVGPPGQDSEAPAVAFTIAPPVPGAWSALPADEAAALRNTIQDGHNVVSVWGDGGFPRPILVEELGWTARPAHLMTKLTAADILQHWSLLTDARRVAHTERLLERLDAEDPEAPVPPDGTSLRLAGPTMFHRLAGVLHAFSVLERRIDAALEAGREREAASLVLGQRFDSLRALLDQINDHAVEDRVWHLLMLLCARDIVVGVRGRGAGLWARHPESASHVEACVSEAVLDVAWAAVDLDPAPGRQGPTAAEFRAWFCQEWDTAVVEP